MDETIIGFDIRERWLPSVELWPVTRRRRFLLREDVQRPLSTDTMVCPSVFDTGRAHGLPTEDRERLHLTGVPTPDWIGANAGLWADLGQMNRTFAAFTGENWIAPRRYTVLAVTWLMLGRSAGDVGPYAEPVVPAVRSPSWQFLGFDVSDGSLMSGLSNCGYSTEEAVSLRKQWASNLNPNHLFDQSGAAIRYCEITDQRVPEHAPFFVYGLYSIPQDDE